MSELLYGLRNVQQVYGDRLVLAIDALDIMRGEVLALVGPSGAGKSTLLRLLNFLEAPSVGDVCFDGVPITAEPSLAVRRRVTMLFQRPILLSRSVHANVSYGLRLRGVPVDGRVEAALERVGLALLAHQPAHKLSGGELQRAALARALVLQPEVLLLDEPTANLDPYNGSLIEDIVREQNQKQGTTVVLVTHNIFQARRLAARTGLLLNGQLVELASTGAFFDRPRDPRTAAFVRGEMVY